MHVYECVCVVYTRVRAWCYRVFFVLGVLLALIQTTIGSFILNIAVVPRHTIYICILLRGRRNTTIRRIYLSYYYYDYTHNVSNLHFALSIQFCSS